MIGWIFIISVLAVLVFHYMFAGQSNHVKPNVDLQIQKYKTIIDKLTQPLPQEEDLLPNTDLSQEDTPSSSDLEDLETYIQSKTAF
jgi:hypothetical protein